MKIGIIGAGAIAKTLAETMRQMDTVTCYAVASRSAEKAEQFAREHGFTKAYGSYEDLVSDEQVELVYIATPHSHHFGHMKLCIEHHKPVLCEKAFTMNAGQAKEIAQLAAREGVFVAEAIWTRYMPSRNIISDMLASGIIGNVSMLTANLSYAMAQKERLLRPELAGGALLDVGVYPLNFALMSFGDEIEKIESSVSYTHTGVDAMETITLFYKDGRMAALNAGMYGRSDRKGIFYGDKGYIIVENINNPQSVTAYDLDDRILKRVEVPAQISGYEYELLECMDRIAKGETESRSMPLAETIQVMELMDGLRRDWGISYPGE